MQKCGNHIVGRCAKPLRNSELPVGPLRGHRSRLLAAVGRGIQGRLFFAESELYGI